MDNIYMIGSHFLQLCSIFSRSNQCNIYMIGSDFLHHVEGSHMDDIYIWLVRIFYNYVAFSVDQINAMRNDIYVKWTFLKNLIVHFEKNWSSTFL